MNNIQDKTPKITFSSDGIRGVSGDWPFTKKGMYCIGQALSKYLLKIKSSDTADIQVVLGRDTRPSGKEYAKVLKKCFVANDIKVIDLGIAPTPAVAYVTKKNQAQLGVVISASHNPAQYNGIKLVDSNGLRLQSGVEKQIEEFSEKEDELPTKPIRMSGAAKIECEKHSHQKIHFVKGYIANHIMMVKTENPEGLKGLKLVIDCSNGAVSRTGKQLLARLGAKVISLNNDTTGEKKINDNCGSEYYRKYPEKLIKIVLKNEYDYGIAFDGDGDRIVVVDREGNFYNGDDLTYILAACYKERGELRKSTIVTTNNANSGLKKSLKKIGVETIKTPNGDKNLEAEMWNKENNYILGAEQVGNIIINDGDHGAADSLYAISFLFARLLAEKEELSQKSILLKEKTESLEKWPQVLATIHMTKKVSQKDINQIKKEIKNNSKLKHHIRIKVWYSSTESGLFNVMMEGSKSENPKIISSLAVRFCKKVSRLAHEKPRVYDLSSRKRLKTVKV